MSKSTIQNSRTRQLSDRVSALSHFGKDTRAMAASIVLALITSLSFGAPWISTRILYTSPTAQDLPNAFEPWLSKTHFLGTDDLGRDVLTRALFAGRVSLTIGITVAIIQSLLGTSLGLLAGYRGGRIDDLINAILQIVRGLPIFYLLIVLSVLFKPTLFNLILVLSAVGWTGACRQVRGLVLSIRERDYVEAARALGASDSHIFIYHILPNVSSIILVTVSFSVASTIITESSLSFLGFGVQAPTPSWGNMLSNALSNLTNAPWLTVVPGVLITTTVFCTFLVADGFRDALNPHLRK